MKRVLLSVAVLLLTLLGLCLPLLSFGSDSTPTVADPVTVNDYKADVTIARDGTLTATETVTAQFPYGRHGLYRYFDLASSYDKGVRFEPKDIHVTMDGAAVPTALSWEDHKRFRVVRIGDADRLVDPGEHVYRLSYTIPGTLGPSNAPTDENGTYSWGRADASMLIWRVVANGWQLPMQQTESTVHLPSEPTSFNCSVTGGGACQVTAPDARTRVVTTGALPPDTGVAVRADFPFPAPSRHTVPWSIHYDPVLGRSLTGLIVALVASLLTFVIGLVWNLRSREGPPLRPVQYGPPADPQRPNKVLGPAQTFYIANEHMSTKALTATIFHLAEEKAVTLDRSDGKNWTVTSNVTPEMLAQLDPADQAVLQGLGLTQQGSVFKADGSADAGRLLGSTQSSLDDAVKIWGSSSGTITISSSEVLGRLLVSFAVIASIVLLIFRWLPATIWVLPLAAFAIGGAGLWMDGVGTRRTKLGRDVWSQASGFERLLSTRSNEERLDFSARKDLFTDYIPYAIAFGCADAWADKYRYATGHEPPEPTWFGGGFYSPIMIGGFGGSGSGFDSFESSLSSSISAYSAQQAASSSSSGGGFGGGGFGGGFGGGGGGGGGGGSW
ncbi:MAG: DUF2207 domain-containing protein [Gordonia sp. (in: high G+C Gram-positive bacteria)]|uniref:DUF2207 domain-containing protein n=1 Tax=Gordonia sp. (in: high G+C Gram-positive bacteria) TaxID=84139 RepID=UPI0039E3355A